MFVAAAVYSGLELWHKVHQVSQYSASEGIDLIPRILVMETMGQAEVWVDLEMVYLNDYS